MKSRCTETLMLSLTVVCVSIISILLLTSPAAADGGPIIPDAFLWASLTENQQIAVVKINPDASVNVDLFISMQDKSGESHEIVYFLPLGYSPANFMSRETTTAEFDTQLTQRYDVALREEARRQEETRASLFPGHVFLNGIWLIPFIAPLVLTGCAGSFAPVASLNTTNSQIDIYGLDTTTDITDLVDVAGLDKSVENTLERLRGQKIAVVKLRTQPVKSNQAGSYQNPGQPGLHFSWTDMPVNSSNSNQSTFTYPLGTGSAWSNPIEITRVYIIAPQEISFEVKYPQLGEYFSEVYVGNLIHRMRDISAQSKPAYTIESANDGNNQIWRATYRLSNSSEDIVVSISKSGTAGVLIKRIFPLRLPIGYSITISIIISLVLWVIAWRYIMPWRIPILSYSLKSPRLWADALVFPGINLGLIMAIALSVILVFLIPPIGILLIIIALIGLLCLPLLIFQNKYKKVSEQSRARLFVTYLMLIFSSNIVYFAIGTIFTTILVGIT
jgi:hypothetical protein